MRTRGNMNHIHYHDGVMYERTLNAGTQSAVRVKYQKCAVCGACIWAEEVRHERVVMHSVREQPGVAIATDKEE